MQEIWEMWIPGVGATGVSFGRCRVDSSVAGDCVLVHAAPTQLSVTVRAADGSVLAEGLDLKRTAEGPMSYLVRDDRRIQLQDVWPTSDDLGRLVFLHGGEAGVLTGWWNAADHRSWRWSIEFTNHA